MTLKDIQQYSPDQITDKVLAAIDADLAKLKTK
jgi:para-nitrobenzyl esterase